VAENDVRPGHNFHLDVIEINAVDDPRVRFLDFLSV